MRNLLDASAGLSLAQLVREALVDTEDACWDLRAEGDYLQAARVLRCGTECALSLEAARRELEAR